MQSFLRVGDFLKARTEAATLHAEGSGDARALAVYGDALWSSGLFGEAEQAYQRVAGARARRAARAQRRGADPGGPRPVRRGVGHSQTGGGAVPARGRVPPHARQRLRAAGPVRRRRRVRQHLHQPAAEGDRRQPRRAGRRGDEVPGARSGARPRTSSCRSRIRSTRCRSASTRRRSSSRAASTAAGRWTSSSTPARS